MDVCVSVGWCGCVDVGVCVSVCLCVGFSPFPQLESNDKEKAKEKANSLLTNSTVLVRKCPHK